VAVADVRFAAGDVLGVPGIDQVDLDPGGLQDLEDGDPGAPWAMTPVDSMATVVIRCSWSQAARACRSSVKVSKTRTGSAQRSWGKAA
jgi:hypothetical protein